MDDNLTHVSFPTIILLFLISALQKEEAAHLQGEKEEGRGEKKKKAAQRILSNFSKSLIEFFFKKTGLLTPPMNYFRDLIMKKQNPVN